MTNDQHDRHVRHDKSCATGVPTGKISAGLAQLLELPVAIAPASHSQLQQGGQIRKSSERFLKNFQPGRCSERFSAAVSVWDSGGW